MNAQSSTIQKITVVDKFIVSGVSVSRANTCVISKSENTDRGIATI